MASPRHFLDISACGFDDLRTILDDAHRRKSLRLGKPKGVVDDDAPASGHVMAMIFEKPSTRTRFSFDGAMRQLGGNVLITNANDMQLGRGEPIEDTARVLSSMVDLIMIRSHAHEDVEALARASAIPVINALTNLSHPCQIMADLMTLEAHFGSIKDLCLAWVGDGNNVCTSLIHAASRFGFRLQIATPKDYQPLSAALVFASVQGADVHVFIEARSAAAGADCVITDTFVSMGDKDYEARQQALMPYQVNEALMAFAKPHAVFMHCLPAHRGEEVSASVMDGPHSLVWLEAENRLHVQKSIIAWCLGRL
jgi:ornithine carbamoyltransferase